VDLTALRAWLDRKLRTEVPDAVWDQLVVDRYARAGLDEDELKELVVDARRLLRAFQAGRALVEGRGRQPPGRESLPDSPDSREVAVNLRDVEIERARVFARLAAQMAAKHPDVISFREDVLDGQLLTHDRARELLTQQGGPDGNGPILQALRGLAKRLSRDYRWRELDAMWFVLTGHTPPVFPLHAVGAHNLSWNGPETAEITLIVEPWVNAKEVEKTYKDLQAQMRGKDNNRPITQRRLKLVEFVEEHRQEEYGGWRLLMDRWNEEHADPPYHDVRNFRTACEETYRLLMHPAYNMPNWQPYAPTPAQEYRDEYRRQEAETMLQKAKRVGPPKMLREG
jgi:hypothetical protein